MNVNLPITIAIQLSSLGQGNFPSGYHACVGDIFRKKDDTPTHAGYILNAFIFPKGTNGNNNIAAGAKNVSSLINGNVRREQRPLNLAYFLALLVSLPPIKYQ